MALAQVEGLAGFSSLRLLELGSNRLREVAGLGHMSRLEELWLGRNRIAAITNISECALEFISARPGHRGSRGCSHCL